MTERQRRYCLAYVDCGCQVEAGRLAGYKDTKSLRHFTSRLHKKREIKELIAQLIDKKYNLNKEQAEHLVYDEWSKSTKDTIKVRLLELWLDVKGYRKQGDTNVTVNNIGEGILDNIKRRRLNTPKVSNDSMLSEGCDGESKGS